MALLAAGIGCQKYETVPEETISEEYIYDQFDRNGTYAQQVVNNIYAHLNPGFNRISNVVLDAATDDAIPSENTHVIEVLSKGRLTAGNNVEDAWAASYACIRKANLFLDRQSLVPRDADTKKFWRAEVRFMRVYSYFELIKRYGGVPLLGDKVFAAGEIAAPSRNSFDECVDYIVKECDVIKDSLRKETTTEFPATEWGKITRGAALALKSRVLLYAASPLNNPTNNPAKWLAAGNAAKAVMDLAYFSLNSSFPGTFVTRSVREVILGHQRPITTDVERNNAPVGYGSPNLSYGYVSPTQDLVEAFPAANGRAITDPASGYLASNPYANRDPRLGWTVFHHGSNWLARKVDVQNGGRDRPGGIQTQTRTGYYMRKFLADLSAATAYSNQTHNFPIFRYAETLLNYAESVNETGNAAEAFNQLKALRLRAGIPAGTTAGFQHGLPTAMTQAELRTAIRNERRIELAYEEHRFWDIRRWKIAETVVNRNVRGIRVLPNTTGGLDYLIEVVDRLYFQAAKHYLYPVPFAEISANPNLRQNSGY